MMDQLCPKCATGVCAYRDGIMCRGVVCPGNHDLFAARDDVPTRPEWPENTHYTYFEPCVDGHEPNPDGSPYVAWLMVRDDFIEHLLAKRIKKGD